MRCTNTSSTNHPTSRSHRLRAWLNEQSRYRQPQRPSPLRVGRSGGRAHDPSSSERFARQSSFSPSSTRLRFNTQLPRVSRRVMITSSRPRRRFDKSATFLRRDLMVLASTSSRLPEHFSLRRTCATFGQGLLHVLPGACRAVWCCGDPEFGLLRRQGRGPEPGALDVFKASRSARGSDRTPGATSMTPEEPLKRQQN